MKKGIAFLFIVWLSYPAASQNIIQPEWVIKKNEGAQSNAEGWGVDMDEEGNLYWPVSVEQPTNGLDIHCYKLDANGQELWTSPLIYGGAGIQQSYVTNAQSSDLYIGGRFCAGLIHTCDMLLLKVDRNSGELIWDRTLNFPFDGYDELDGLEITSDGIYCGGWAQALEEGIFNSDIGLWKLDFDGNTLWSNSFGQVGSAEHQDGHFVVDENFIYAAGLWNGHNALNLYNGHSFLGKFSKDTGEFSDSTLFGYPSNNFLDIENALGMTTDGTYLYITGYSTPVQANDWQIFIAKYDKQLQQIWIKHWGDNGTETARGIVVKNDIIYIAGLTESTSLSQGAADALLLQMDTDGNFISYQTWGDEQDNALHDIVVHENNIYLSGTSTATASPFDKSAFLLKTIVQSNSLSTPSDKAELFKVRSNPTKGRLEVLFPESQHVGGNLLIADAQGKKIGEAKIAINQRHYMLRLPKTGVYFVSFFQNGKISSKKVINLLD